MTPLTCHPRGSGIGGQDDKSTEQAARSIGLGRTQAAHDLCVNIPDRMKAHYMQPAVGHYGVFNGSRFRSEIVPRIVDFMASHGSRQDAPSRPRLVRGGKA